VDPIITRDVSPDLVVTADELLGSVVETPVRSAIQHDDTETPRTTVSAPPRDETVLLSISILALEFHLRVRTLFFNLLKTVITGSDCIL
jgi:hypothetical protein